MKKTLLLFMAFIAIIRIQAQNAITVDDIWTKGTFETQSVPGFRFMNDGLHYTKRVGQTITKNNFLNGEEVAVILNGTDLQAPGYTGSFQSYQFSDDEKKILLKTDTESIYRRSTKAHFFVYDLNAESITPVFQKGKVMHATFSPNGQKVAFVFQNNLYFKDLKSQEVVQITMDGKWNEIINGSCDWVYEEEFGFTKAFAWSNDSRNLAFLRFDESQVKEFTMTTYHDGMYPNYETFKYPKVGEANSKVTVHIFQTEQKSLVKVEKDSGEDGYIPRIKWTHRPNELCVFQMNRHQNHLDLWIANASDGKTRLLLSEDNKYYIDIHDNLTFLKSGEGFIWTSEKEGWNQVYLYNNSGKIIRKLTTGDYDVTNFYGVDERNRKIYFQAADRSALERHVYSIDFRGRKKVAMTDRSGWNSAQFNSNYEYYVWNHSDANTPGSFTVYSRKGKFIRSLENNADIKKKMVDYDVQKVEFFAFKTSEGVQLNGYMIKPQDFDPGKKYPVFMNLYGGPGSQQVTNAWKGSRFWWYQLMADHGYLIACVDNRGTGGRGEEFKKMTYLKLGHYETIDQIEAAKYLGGLPYTDASRIGIFGWSYGGYMSSLCLFKGNDVFKTAIAVAPVTNWKWYDSIYTERYMRSEEENPDGYRDNSPVYFADQLKGNYLLVHGIADDNVHFQNSAEMTAALIKANKQFDTYVYPNRNHGIYGDNARRHLYTKMTNFLLEKL